MKKKAKWFKNNPVPMPRSDDAGWIIHCELFIQRMWLAFMLNTLLASFDFLFHYSLCFVPLRNSNLFISESLFFESEKKNTWETTFSWCWSDTANTSLGKDSLAVQAFSWNSGKQCSYPIQLQMNSVTLGKSLSSLYLWLHICKMDIVFLSVRYCKARHVKDDKLPSYYGNWKST